MCLVALIVCVCVCESYFAVHLPLETGEETAFEAVDAKAITVGVHTALHKLDLGQEGTFVVVVRDWRVRTRECRVRVRFRLRVGSYSL